MLQLVVLAVLLELRQLLRMRKPRMVQQKHNHMRFPLPSSAQTADAICHALGDPLSEAVCVACVRARVYVCVARAEAWPLIPEGSQQHVTWNEASRVVAHLLAEVARLFLPLHMFLDLFLGQ